jgi:hypothetical protein
VLRNSLKEVTFGSKVKIVYLGKLRSANGNNYGNFDVFVDKPDQPGNGAGVGPTLNDDQKFALLFAKIQKEKGQVIASALQSATAMSNDKLAALREAAAQVGVVDTTDTVPF